jgi:hypothetical protein
VSHRHHLHINSSPPAVVNPLTLITCSRHRYRTILLPLPSPSSGSFFSPTSVAACESSAASGNITDLRHHLRCGCRITDSGSMNGCLLYLLSLSPCVDLLDLANELGEERLYKVGPNSNNLQRTNPTTMEDLFEP